MAGFRPDSGAYLALGTERFLQALSKGKEFALQTKMSQMQAEQQAAREEALRKSLLGEQFKYQKELQTMQLGQQQELEKMREAGAMARTTAQLTSSEEIARLNRQQQEEREKMNRALTTISTALTTGTALKPDDLIGMGIPTNEALNLSQITINNAKTFQDKLLLQQQQIQSAIKENEAQTRRAEAEAKWYETRATEIEEKPETKVINGVLKQWNPTTRTWETQAEIPPRPRGSRITGTGTRTTGTRTTQTGLSKLSEKLNSITTLRALRSLNVSSLAKEFGISQLDVIADIERRTKELQGTAITKPTPSTIPTP